MNDNSPALSHGATEPVGAALARWRKRKKMSGQALGEKVNMSQAKISRLETGASAPDPNDVRTVAEGLGLPAAEVERLVDLAEQSNNTFTDWRPTHLGLADRQNDLRHLEASAREFRVFQPAVVVGLLQTSEYARELLSSLERELDDEGIADSAAAVPVAVAARMQRNPVLAEPDRTFHFLMTESVLSNRVCSPGEMLAQIQRIRTISEQENVTVRLVPAETHLPLAPYHGFELMDDRCVLVDLFNASLMSRGRRTVRHYLRVFDALERVGTTEIAPILDKYQVLYARMLLPA